MLADHADAVGGKLYISGGGWSLTGPDPPPGAIAMDVKVPWDERDDEHQLVLELVDADGQAVLVPTQFGVQPLRIEAMLTLDGVEVDPAVRPGTPLDAPFAINYAPVPLMPGQRYEWRLSVNDHHDEDWCLPFTVRAADSQAEAA
jgi:Family of unknown function (DUF6941)